MSTEGDLVKWVSYEDKKYKGIALKKRGKNFLYKSLTLRNKKLLDV